MLDTSNARSLPDGRTEEVIVPGQRMTSVSGEFIPGASIRGDRGQFQFIPGLLNEHNQFVAGQFVQKEAGADPEFVRGQVRNTTELC